MVADNETLIDDAVIFATKAHRKQVDKAGLPYILHPLRVMNRLRAYGYCPAKSPHVFAAAVLHDVVEDTNRTLEEIDSNFGHSVWLLVSYLTREEDETHGQYLDRMINEPHIGVLRRDILTIKLCDTEDNADISRTFGLDPKHFSLMKRYAKQYNLIRAALAAMEER